MRLWLISSTYCIVAILYGTLDPLRTWVSPFRHLRILNLEPKIALIHQSNRIIIILDFFIDEYRLFPFHIPF